jgi:ATP-binding cassette, subfamily B, bacterial
MKVKQPLFNRAMTANCTDRAFFRDAPILILDESTSAIDAMAEYEIFERLYGFSKDKTLLIVSHRFSTVRNVQVIHVINNGQIINRALTRH